MIVGQSTEFMAVDTIFYDLVTPEPYSVGSEMKHSSVALRSMETSLRALFLLGTV